MSGYATIRPSGITLCTAERDPLHTLLVGLHFYRCITCCTACGEMGRRSICGTPAKCNHLLRVHSFPVECVSTAQGFRFQRPGVAFGAAKLGKRAPLVCAAARAPAIHQAKQCQTAA